MTGRQAFNTNSLTIKTLPEPPSSVLRLQKRCNRAAYDSAINQCRTTALLWGCSNLRNHQTYRLGLTTTISPKQLLVLLLPLLALSKQASLWYQLLTLQVPRQQHGGTHNDCRYLRKGKISITVHFQVQFQHQNKHQTASSHKKHMGLTAARHQKSIWKVHYKQWIQKYCSIAWVAPSLGRLWYLWRFWRCLRIHMQQGSRRKCQLKMVKQNCPKVWSMQALQVQRAMFFAFMIQHELEDEQNHRKTMNLLAIGAGSCISGAGASAASVVSIGALPSCAFVLLQEVTLKSRSV